MVSGELSSGQEPELLFSTHEGPPLQLPGIILAPNQALVARL